MRQASKWTLIGLLIWALASWGLAPTARSQLSLSAVIQETARQLDLALQQSLLASSAPTLENVQALSHQLLNLLEGQSGPDYDPRYPIAGDQLGLIEYASQIETSLQDARYQHRFDVTVDNIMVDFKLALARTQQVLQLTALGDTREKLNETTAFLSAAKGRADDVPPLGGILFLAAQIAQP